MNLKNKICIKCKVEKPLSEFACKGKTRRRRPDCHTCWTAYHKTFHRNWRKANPARVRAQNLKKYGATIGDYDRMFAEQDGKCAICRRPPPPGRNLDVDHDHVLGGLRGLLCNNCNRGIGHLKDDPVMCRSAADYLSI